MSASAARRVGGRSPAGGAARARVLARLSRFVAALDAGLRGGEAPARCLWRAARRHGLVVPELRPGLPIPGPASACDVRLTSDLLFGASRGEAPGAARPQAMRLVSYGAKPACVIQGPEADASAVLASAWAQGLVGLLSPTESVLLTEQPKGGFSNVPREVRPARPGSGGWRELVVARDERYAILAWAGLAYGWDALLGAALGFPTCCVDHFVATWDRALAEHRGDPAGLLLERDLAVPADWRLNVLGRYRGHRVLEHFPCRWTCAPSLRLAARYTRALARHEPAALRRLADQLRGPYLYTTRHGVLSFPGADVREVRGGWRVSYAPEKALCTCADSELLALVRRADTLAASPAAVVVLGRRFEGRIALFA